MNDSGVTPILGTMLMMAMMMTLVPGVLMLRQSWSDTVEAQTDVARAEREAAELAAFCARNPSVPEPECPSRGPRVAGYDCRPVALWSETWVCEPRGSGRVDVVAAPGASS